METHLKLCENERLILERFNFEENEFISSMWNRNIEERLTIEKINSIYDLTLI